MQVDEFGDVVYLSGELESGLFELSVLTVECESNVDELFLVFTENCTDRWLGDQTFIQGCKLDRHAPRSQQSS